LAAEKKKTITAACLIALMAFMWIRLLADKAPQTADAAAMKRRGQQTKQQSQPVTLTYAELPVVKGRNDVLARDFFTAKDGLLAQAKKIKGNRSEGSFKPIEDKFKLEAIVLGENPRAYINNKLMSVGDRFPASDGVNIYEYEVVAIGENKVVVSCGKEQITLKLSHGIEVTD